MNRKSRSITRRSSILKIDVNRDDDTGIVGGKNRRSSRRVSFAEMCQIKEFQRDSPKVFKDFHPDDDTDGRPAESSAQSKNQGITGLDKLLTGAIQTPYQDVAEYPIPEVSSESFNIFDINRTVLDTVDMDTTQVGGSIDTFFPQMDFQNEPSMELKFDTMSFLQSLQGKPSDRLKTMQIYSPKRDRYLQEQSSPDGPSLPLNFNNMDHDKENMVPMEALQSFTNSNQVPETLKCFQNEEPQASVDSRMFLQSLFGGKTKKTEETQNDMEEMEETACIDGMVREVDKADMSKNSGAFTIGQNDDVTRYFNSEDVTVGIEETKCVGGIVNEVVNVGHIVDANKENSMHLANQTVHMEETRPVGGILKGGLNNTLQTGLRMQQGFNVGIEAENNVTRCFKMEEDADDGLEETKCVGGILSKADVTVQSNANESQIGRTVQDRVPLHNVSAAKSNSSVEVKEIQIPSPMEGIAQDVANINNLTPDATINFNITSMQDNMEETKAIGGIIDRTITVSRNEQTAVSEGKSKIELGNQTVTMEETVALGQILDTSREGLMNQTVNKSVIVSKQLVDSTTVMEETKPVGGILRNSQSMYEKLNLSSQQEQEMEITKNITVPMEETKAVGGFLDRSETETVQTPHAKKAGSNKTVDVSVAMEETKALGGFLDKTVSKAAFGKSSETDFVDKTIDYTVAMEETKAVGRILEKTNSDQITFESKDNSCFNKTLNQTVPIEETKTVGGILNKTSDQTMYFDEVNTDWLSKDLKSDSNGKSADGTTVEGHNKTVAIEETKCVGGILTTDMEMMKGKFENMYNHANDDNASNKTVLEQVRMEETRCVTAVLNDTSEVNTGAEFRSDENHELKNQSSFSDKRESKSEGGMETDFCMKSKEIEGENGTGSEKNVESNGNNVEIDEEITFKISNKRNFDECRGETVDKNEEKTKDFTQTQTNLAKLKEMLILSKRKTAAHLRQGDIRTPSKFSPLFPGSAPASSSKVSGSKFDVGMTRSPVHKRQRLSVVGLGVDGETDNDFGGNEKTDATAALLMGFEDDGLTTGLLENSKIENTDIQGIDDEEMPDTLHHDLCASNTSSDTHSDKNSTVHSDRVSTTVHESNETHSSGNDTRNSSSVNLSMFSNKSFAHSFVVPEGPLSLESFFKLTFTLSNKIQGTRCSTIFAPRIDLDDLAEVLHAELTLNPLVQAKKILKADITQQIEKSEASMEWLEKSLEETQPEIFQECSKASSDELQQITGQLRSLLLACYKEVEITWKERTKEMFSEALHDIQENGVRRAEEMLHKVQNDNQSLDDLLISLDDDLESLDRNDQLLEELQSKEENLNREMKKLTVSLQKKSEEENELHLQIKSRSQKDVTEEMKSLLKQEMISHLICCEWNLDELGEDLAVFTFLDDKVELHVDFILGAEEKQISNITLRIKSTDNMFFEDKVACAFVLNGITTDSLKQRFTTYSSLPKFLHEVSLSINEIRMFCKDLEEVHTYNVLKFENNSVCIELWDRSTKDFIKASFKFNPSHPLTDHVETSVTVRIGKLKSCYIEDKLREVTPGPRYLSRLIQAVNFKLFKNDTSIES